ncbi:DUF2236 domain-containing protein [Hoyosella sp. G463]|uniref:DUF2236 domain-containing protein n=1 Tax=Lolliginicoccus lacisalsi TaxID=2742202 RepID=A0A927JA58_9ACTN|nr:oxygenase MpaB family protein [Lolliginicoccus lacisalsi]MBD8505393.1 DUF2236 domain-containing protein [Lolliginicoccus lacisalsi]
MRWSRRQPATLGLDPERDHARMSAIVTSLEFPWDYRQALSLALFRTFAVPSIGNLLARTGEFTARTQRRYDDTALLLDVVQQHGFAHPESTAAIRRINHMHRAYSISNDDMLYVLTTFVVTTSRWVRDYGWRDLTDDERAAGVRYWTEMGRRMGVRDIPTTYAGFADHLDAYEREHFAYSNGGRAVADATLDLLCTFPGARLLPGRLVRRGVLSVMDDLLLDALRYPRPTSAERRLVHGALRGRALIVRFLPRRKRPFHAIDAGTIRSYPHGFEIAELGTFPERGATAAKPNLPA